MSSKRMYQCFVQLGFCERENNSLTGLQYSFDKIHNIRQTLVESLKKEFPDYGLT